MYLCVPKSFWREPGPGWLRTSTDTRVCTVHTQVLLWLIFTTATEKSIMQFLIPVQPERMDVTAQIWAEGKWRAWCNAHYCYFKWLQEAGLPRASWVFLCMYLRSRMCLIWASVCSLPPSPPPLCFFPEEGSDSLGDGWDQRAQRLALSCLFHIAGAGLPDERLKIDKSIFHRLHSYKVCLLNIDTAGYVYIWIPL